MTDENTTPAPDPNELLQRLAALEAENAALRAERIAPATDAAVAVIEAEADAAVAVIEAEAAAQVQVMEAAQETQETAQVDTDADDLADDEPAPLFGGPDAEHWFFAKRGRK